MSDGWPADAYARAWERMTEVLLTEREPGQILEALAQIAGETLRVDRALIYQIQLEEALVVALSEWLNPAVAVTPTKATYPLSVFRGGDAEARRTKTYLESHAASPHPALVADGSAALLHGPMSVQSLLWYPFDFRDAGYYALVFNQVTHRRAWRQEELEFLRVTTRQVHLALLQIAWHAESASAERMMLEAQKAESVRLLVGGVAHDFNGLLGIVLTNLARSRSGLGEGSPHAASLRDAERAAHEAAELAKRLLTYAGKGQFLLETLDVSILARDVEELLRSRAAPTPVELTTEPSAFVRADAGQLRQVLMNLVGNAHEAMDGRTGRIAISIRVAGSEGAAEKRVLLTVTDEGEGMSPEVQRRIFEPFFSTKAPGRGLGLAAVSGIVRAHDGELLVDSVVGRGTSVTVSLPLAEATTVRSEAAGGRALLLVDDNENFRRMCQSLLIDMGYTVLSAHDGESAVHALEHAQHGVDGALIDWTMPGLSGDETLRRLRALRPDLPIVIMSGHRAHVAEPHVGRDATTFLEKPFAPEALVSALRRVLPRA